MTCVLALFALAGPCPPVDEDAVAVWGVLTVVMHPKSLDINGLESDIEFVVQGLGKTVARLRSKAGSPHTSSPLCRLT